MNYYLVYNVYLCAEVFANDEKEAKRKFKNTMALKDGLMTFL